MRSENGEPLPGVNILIQGTYDGTSSGEDGAFQFTTLLTGSHTIVASFIGFQKRTQDLNLVGVDVFVQIQLKEEVNQLDMVTISAGTFAAGDDKRRTVLKPRDIATTAGATADIAGAFNTLPGTQKVGEVGRLFVRGGDDSETRTFIDGMLVGDAYRAAAPGTPARSRFMPFMFKGTSFSTGGYSAEYGQALSSALILNSRDFPDFNQTDISLMSVGADVGHTQAWSRSSVSGKIQYMNLKPYMNIINQRIDWIEPPVSWEGNVSFRQRIAKDGMLKVYSNISNTDFSLNNQDVTTGTRQRMDVTNKYGYLNSVYSQSLTSTWSIRGGASYTTNENKFLIGGLPTGEKEIRTHAKMVLENTFEDKLDTRVGIEYLYLDYIAYRPNTSTGSKEQTAFQENVMATFAESEYLISKHFVIKGGLRSELNQLINTLSIDPRLALAYKPGKNGQFSIAYGQFRQTPKNEYLRTTLDLEQEKAQHIILNYQLLTEKRIFRIEAFYKHYSNLVKSNSQSLEWSNLGNGYAKGLEFFWRDNKTVKNVDYWISYSFLDTERNYLNFEKAAVPTFASSHNFSIVYKHFIKPIKVQAGITYCFASGRPYFNPNNQDFLSDRTPAYHDLSINLAYVQVPNLIFYFSCTNVLGYKNVFGYRYSTIPNTNGVYDRKEILQPADRLLLLSIFITISKNKTIGQLPNL